MAYRNSFLPGDALAITPTDDVAVDLIGVRNGGDAAADITVYTAGGGTTARLLKNVQPGETIVLKIVQVRATGTTATLVTGFLA
jgi:hypothetical protein